MNKIIALWTHPRSVSTAFERMMMARGDLAVIHEPFSLSYYTDGQNPDAPYMHTDPGQPCTYREARDRILKEAEKETVFFKDMCYHCFEDLMEDDDFLSRIVNTFLVREPVQSVASHYRINSELTRDEIGYEQEYKVFEKVAEMTQTPPVVIDADDLLEDPAGIAAAYCQKLDLPFMPEALSWEAGHREEWNTWKEWHRDAANSTRIRKKKKKVDFDITEIPRLKAYVDYHGPFYKALHRYRLKPEQGVPAGCA